RALELDGQHLGALELARRLAKLGGDDKSYGAATARLASAVLERERAAGFYREAAETFERAGADREAAGAWRAVLDRTPLDGNAFNRARDLLHALHVIEKNAGPLVELYAHRLEHVRGAARRREALLRLAELEEQAGHVDEAVGRLEEAIHLAPTPAEARGEHEKLAQLLVRQRQWQKAVEALRRLSELIPDGPSRAAVEIR